MTIPSLKELMAAGAHFGHKRERSHPKAKSYIYTLREGIYIIDLQKTQEQLEAALKAINDWAKEGKTILFVGTKPQAADIVKQAAESVGMPYMTHRWPGGLLTNFDTVLQNLKQIAALEAQLASEQAANLTKKEKLVISEKIKKSNMTLHGIRNLKNLPDALFVVDVVTEATAVEEAYRLGLPIVGMTDTNANPGKIDFPIPANDDARKSIELIVGLVAGTIKAHKGSRPVVQEVVEATAQTAAAAVKTEAEQTEAGKSEPKESVQEKTDTETPATETKEEKSAAEPNKRTTKAKATTPKEA